MSLNEAEPPPMKSEHPACWDIVFERHEFQEIGDRVKSLLEADIRERDAMGTEKYGVRLHPYNGRNSLHDVYQEQLDALVYSVKYFYETRHETRNGERELHERMLNAYRLFKRTLALVVDTRRLIFRLEGR